MEPTGSITGNNLATVLRLSMPFDELCLPQGRLQPGEVTNPQKAPGVALEPSQFRDPFGRRDRKTRGGLEQPGRAGEVKKFAAGFGLDIIKIIISTPQVPAGMRHPGTTHQLHP